MLRLTRHIKNYGFKNKPFYLFSLVILLYSIADGMVSFFLPVFVKRIVPSMALVGLILASSSIWNIVADLFLGFKKKIWHYKKLVTVSFLLLLLLIIINFLPKSLIGQLKLITLFLLMMFWGFYYESMSWGTSDFIVGMIDQKEQASSFGLIQVVTALGYTIGPVIAGSMILFSNNLTLIITGFFALMGFFLFLSKGLSKFSLTKVGDRKRILSIRTEFKLWKLIGVKILPLLLVSLSLGLYTGIVFSFTPILTALNHSLLPFGGLIVSLFSAPTILFSGWFGALADKRGRKPVILLGMFLIFLAIGFFGVVQQVWLALLMALVSGLGASAFIPALNAEFTSYINRHFDQRKRDF